MTATSESIANPAELDVSALTDRAFAALLIRNAYRPTRIDQEWEHLTAAANIERAQQVLNAMLDRNTGIVQERKAQNEQFRAYCFTQKHGHRDWVAANAEFEQWRSTNNAHRRRITTAITEVNKARKDSNRARFSEQHSERPVVRELAIAIERHRQRQADNAYKPTAADRVLWKCLDDLTLPTGPDRREISLTDLLTYHWTAEPERDI